MEAPIPWNAVRLFKIAVYTWTILFTLTALPAYTTLWSRPISPALPAPSALGVFTHAFSTWAEGYVPVGIAVLLIACMYQLMRPGRWYVALLIWMIHTSLMHQAWLAGSGGQQLMANMLFWLIFIPDRPAGKRETLKRSVHSIAFWIMRLQLLLAYAATALHKLTGTHWPQGTAMGIAASDPAFGPGWLVQFPLVAAVLTWLVLAFQLTFPVAVWFRPTRIPWMIFGLLFHVATAIWLGIPEMALAFIVCYAIWLDERQAGWFIRRSRMIDQ